MALTQISTGGIKDDAVTDAKLPANSVGNSEMKDDAVGVAELSATGTAGNTTFLRGDNTWATPPDTDTNTQLSTEEVQDIVGAMFTGNTETNITATYQDSDGTIDLVGSSGVGGATGVDFNDDIKSRWGTGNDIEIYHRNSDSSAVIKNVNDTGFLRILSGDSDSSGILLKNRDDDVTYLRAKNEAGVELFYADATTFETVSGGAKVTGKLEVNGDVQWDGSDGSWGIYWDKSANGASVKDDKYIGFGTGNDLKLYHDGSHSFLENSTGALVLKGADVNVQNTDGDKLIYCHGDIAELWYNNAKKLETTSGGVQVTGNMVADAFYLGDSEKLYCGVGDDLQIYHDGNNSYVHDNGTGSLILRSSRVSFNDASNNEWARINADGLHLGGTTSANAINDYEEGTFTPSWNNVTNASTHAVWNYVKIGKLVYVNGWFHCDSTTNSGSSNVTFTVPFTSKSNPTNGNADHTGTVMHEHLNNYSSGNFVTHLGGNDTEVHLYRCQQNGTWNTLRSDDVSVDDNMVISFSYIAA